MLGAGPGRCSLMMTKDFLFQLISNVLARGCGARRGPNNDDEGFLVSAEFKCFSMQVWGQKGAQ